MESWKWMKYVRNEYSCRDWEKGGVNVVNFVQQNEYLSYKIEIYLSDIVRRDGWMEYGCIT